MSGSKRDRLQYFVVGDRKLNSGNGTYVKDFETLRTKLLATEIKTAWTLVLSVHGNESVVATTGGALKDPKSSKAYRADRLKKLFVNDTKMKRWRRKYGPMHIVLNACQLAAPFERVLHQSFLKPSSKQKAHGLGGGCRPDTMIMELTFLRRGTERHLERRSQYTQLSRSRRREKLDELKQLNKDYGYFGAPTVPDSEVLHYYFNEEPRGGWPVVRISWHRRRTPIVYSKRLADRDFHKKCPAHWGKLRGRRSRIPTIDED